MNLPFDTLHKLNRAHYGASVFLKVTNSGAAQRNATRCAHVRTKTGSAVGGCVSCKVSRVGRRTEGRRVVTVEVSGWRDSEV